MIEFYLTDEQIEKMQPLLRELEDNKGLILAQVNHDSVSAKFVDLTTAIKIVNILKQDGYYEN